MKRYDPYRNDISTHGHAFTFKYKECRWKSADLLIYCHFRTNQFFFQFMFVGDTKVEGFLTVYII